MNLTNATQPRQECRSGKKKKHSMIEEGTALIEDDLEDNPGTNDIVNNDTTHDVEPGIPNELKSDLGSYWVLEESS